MIPMSELIKDPDYKRFLTTKPKLPPISRDKTKMSTPPWVVYVQRDIDGAWGKREFWKYSEAFIFFKRAMKLGVHDATINCRRIGFEPPSRFVRIKGKFIVDRKGVKRQATTLVYWKPAAHLEAFDHVWCKYCRRPTVFKFYKKHKRLGVVDSTTSRCCICGASARIALMPSDKRRV